MPLATFHTDGSAFVCDICETQFDTKQKAQSHLGTHVKRYLCAECPRKFSRSDEESQHMWTLHRINTPHVCYMMPCSRGRWGLKSTHTLINHLNKSHDGATLADNEESRKARGLLGLQGTSSQSHDYGTSPDDEEMADVTEDKPDDNDKSPSVPTDEKDMDLFHRGEDRRAKSAAEYEATIDSLKEQLEIERKDYETAIEDIHAMWKKKLENLMTLIVSQSIEEVKEALEKKDTSTQE
ncbi:hypothetical protein PGQ11_010712 [Apiospora arundinis]|uniref:C2H2-type domain-containing protein n=1 Tax=Apiospora arundinis TaxID=335852 RepID=A0ABR2IB80_9PEZI